jgi:hypothetical protein
MTIHSQTTSEANRLMEIQHLGGTGGDNCDLPTDPEPKREENCVICGQAGVLVDDGWYKEAFIERGGEEGEEDYLEGEGYLIEAVDTASGWVCSTACESQVMYQRLETWDQEKLDAVADACRVINEYGDRAREIVNQLTNGYVGEELVIQAREFLHSVHGDNDPVPAWINRPSRVEELELVINDVRTTAEYVAKGLFGPEKAGEIADRLRKAIVRGQS